MGCKAHGAAKYRSNLLVVRILANRATPQTAFYLPRIPYFASILQIGFSTDFAQSW